MIVLASASPRRRELLTRIGLSLTIAPADVDETPRDGELPAHYVARIARAKADAVHGEWVIAADTTVTLDNAILGKAESPGEATAMLRALAGRTHQVLTGFIVRGGGGERAQVVTTEVAMVPFDDRVIAGYVASGEWRGKAGAYAIQGIAAALVREIHGSVTNVVGLPVAEVIAALAELGGPRPQWAAGTPA